MGSTVSSLGPSSGFSILSNGHTLFTSDKRISIVHMAKTIRWRLVIKEADFKDAGQYECQVSSEYSRYT